MQEIVQKFQNLYDACGEASCLRNNYPSHFTASACLVCLATQSVLLAKHIKLGKWLQLGGHIEFGERPALAALRECAEESAVPQDLIHSLVYFDEAVPIDLDIHHIPETRNEPSHYHFDLRYAFCTEYPQLINLSVESEELAWVPFGNIKKYSREESLLRLVNIVVSHLSRHEQLSS